MAEFGSALQNVRRDFLNQTGTPILELPSTSARSSSGFLPAERERNDAEIVLLLPCAADQVGSFFQESRDGDKEEAGRGGEEEERGGREEDSGEGQTLPLRWDPCVD